MKISVITPSFNQGKYIERTILSVINQRGSFELEYIIIDGGSTDNTLDLIKKYQDSLTWISETDRGQSDAINKGFNMATGDLFAWLNADDTYEENALSEVVERYREYRFKWCFGNCRNINEDDQEIRRLITRYKIAESKRYSYRRLLSKDFISQPAVFFTKDIYREIGPLDINCQYSMYKKAAYETYLTAKRHATTQDKYLILRHYLHYRMLSLVYRFL
ncbi:MAG: glycosyltransferase [Deltaproteobacteria bacterium]|nr:glycosyltransferase [Deltaproteobacteria bacterium]